MSADTEIPRDTLERWALAVHDWLSEAEGLGVVAEAMVATKMDRRAVLAGIQLLRDEGLWVVQVDERGRIRASPIDDPMFVKAPLPDRWCHHHRTYIDASHRLVSCRDCGMLIDPFDALNDIANHQIRLRVTADHAQRESDARAKSLAKVKREEDNAKARVRAARDRAAELEVRVRQLQAEVEALERLAARQQAGAA